MGHFRSLKLPLVLSAIILLIFVAGCSAAMKPVNKDGVTADQNNNLAVDKKQPDINFALYFVKFTADDTYLVREQRLIPHTQQVAEAALQELISDPRSIFPPGTEVLGINLKNGLATVNFNEAVLNASNLGSTGEALGIQSVVNTLTEFPGIEKVAFQVNGSSEGRARDWWGHVGLYDQPFTRDLSRVYEPAIWVTHPSDYQVAGVPLLVKGSARVYEGTVNVRLLDDRGNVLTESHCTATNAAAGRGDFEISLKFEPPADGEGKLELYWISPEDGSIKDKVCIPLQWP